MSPAILIVAIWFVFGVVFIAGLIWAAHKSPRIETPITLTAQDIMLSADDPLTVTAWDSYREDDISADQVERLR